MRSWEDRKSEQIRAETARRNRSRARFWDLKTRFSYYLISVPFAVLGVAIASFPYNATIPTEVILLEVGSWIGLLLSGAFGLMAKWGEKDQPRLESVSAGGRIARLREARDESDVYNRGSAEFSMRTEKRRVRAERFETWGGRLHGWLLAFAFMLWLSSRASLAAGAAT